MGFKNCFRHLALNHCVHRKLATEALKSVRKTNQMNSLQIEDGNLTKSQQSRRPGKETVNRINMFFSSHPDLKNILPESYLLQKPSSKRFRIFLIDKVEASDIMKVLQPHLTSYGGHIMEINAGAGILTEELFKARLPNLRIYDPDPTLCDNLMKLKKLHKSDARLFIADIDGLSNILKTDARQGLNQMEMLFDGVPTSEWQNEPVIKVIGALPDERFIVHIMFSTAIQSGLCKYGRPELFLMFPLEKYQKLTSTPDNQKTYRSNSVAFQVLFDHQELARIRETAFVPWCLESKSKKKPDKGKEDSLCLVRITPKRDLMKCLSPDVLRIFIFFVKYMMHKKSAYLIEVMERWVPGCGVRLISQGYSIFTDCGSLTPDEYFKIFCEFTSWPEFYSSSFLTSAETLLAKLLQYELTDEVISDVKFGKMVNKKSNEEEEDVYDEGDSLDSKRDEVQDK